MPSQRNLDQLESLKAKLERSSAIILADYSGLSVSGQNELRQKVADTEAEFSVTKNNLLRLALKDKLKEIPPEVDRALNGPTAVLLSYHDAASATKALVNFISDNELPRIKVGLLRDRLLTTIEIEQLAKLPGKDQLIATLLSQLNAPSQNFVSVIHAPLRNLVYVLSAIKDTKGGDN